MTYTIQTATKELFVKLYQIEGEVTTEKIKAFYPDYTAKTSWSTLMQWLIAENVQIVEIFTEVKATPPALTQLEIATENIEKAINKAKKVYPIFWDGSFSKDSKSVEALIEKVEKFQGCIGYDLDKSSYYFINSSNKIEYTQSFRYPMRQLMKGLEPTVIGSTQVRQEIKHALKRTYLAQDLINFSIGLEGYFSHSEELKIILRINHNEYNLAQMEYTPATDTWQGVLGNNPNLKTGQFTSYTVVIEKLMTLMKDNKVI